MSTLRPSRLATGTSLLALLATAAGAGLLPTAAATAATASTGSVTVSAAAKDPATAALRRAKVTVSGVRPASATRTRWTLPVSGTPTVGATTVSLSGRLRFARGKRNVSFGSLRLTLGRTPAISGTVGKRRVTVLTLTGSPKRDAVAGTISVAGSRAALTPAAARLIRTRLSASRVRAGRLGRAAVTVRVPAASPPAPVVPAPVVPVPFPVDPNPGPPPGPPTPDPDPDPPTPDPTCWVPTPVGATDWIACDPTTGGNLRSWITYITGGGSIELSGSVSPTTVGGRYDYRLTPAAPVVNGDSTVTIAHGGGVRYRFTAHMLDITVQNLTFRVSADRTSAEVTADATYTPRPPADPTPVTSPGVHVFDVDLAAAVSKTTGGGATTYVLAPSRLTAVGREVWGDTYEVGAAFGAFTISVPD